MTAAGTAENNGSPGERIHFEETLALGNKKTALVLSAAIVLIPTIVASLIVPLNSFENVALVGGGYAVALLVLALVARGLQWQARVRVTDATVEVEQSPGPLLRGESNLVLPFEDITRVQYSEARDPRIHVTTEDQWDGARSGAAKPRSFAVSTEGKKGSPGTYLGGIRVERADGPPVYIGSEEPGELAATIVERATDVGDVEPFRSSERESEKR